jgi:hypothetical protein
MVAGCIATMAGACGLSGTLPRALYFTVKINVDSTQDLNARFLAHCEAVKHTSGATQRYHMLAGGGLYQLLKARAIAGDDEVVVGAPHWLLYPTQVQHV